MKRKHHSPEQIIHKLRQADAELAAGQPIAAVCQKLGIAEATFHRWRNQYGGMKANDARRRRPLRAGHGGRVDRPAAAGLPG